MSAQASASGLLSQRRSPDPVAALLAALSVSTLLYWLWLLTGWGGAALQDLFANLLDLPTYCLSAAVIFACARRQQGAARTAWTLVGLAVASYALGVALWAHADLVLHDQPFPSLADAGFLATTPFFAAALLLMPRVKLDPARAVQVVLDIGITVAAAGVFAWLYLITPVLADTNLDWFSTAISLAYPTFDIVLVAMLLSLALVDTSRPMSQDRLFLIVGLGFFVAADVAFALLSASGQYGTGNAIDGLWALGAVAFALASWTALRGCSTTKVLPREGNHRIRDLLARYSPYGAMLLTYAVLLSEHDSPGLKGTGVIVGTTAVTLLVVLRQLFSQLENQRLTRALEEREARFRSLVQNATDVITVVAADGRILYESPSVTRILGYLPEEVLGHNALDLVHPEDLPRIIEDLKAAIESGTRTARPYRCRSASGKWLWLESVATNLLDDPAVGGVVVNSRDVTEREQASAQLAFHAMHDGLTGLPNRTSFRAHLEDCLQRGATQPFAVAFLDLDRFKQVNDTLGHAAGDSLLKQVASRITSSLRDGDVLARVSGDEFALLLLDTADEASAEVIATRLLDVLSAPFQIEGKEVHVSASFGFSFSPQQARSSTELLRNADSAMYAAKQAGRSTYRIFTPSMGAAAMERRAFEHDLRAALEDGKLELYYQPQVDLRSGAILSCEALLRWTHPVMGVVPPSRFIPVAEETGMIVPLGRWVLERACRDCATWQEAGKAPVRVSVNVSALQFARSDFLATVAEALAKSGLAPELLELELTESALLHDETESAAQMARLRAVGVTLALDDFGIGHAGIAYLQRLPLDVLKIDRSITRPLEGARPSPILKALVELALGLGLTVVPEGVEDQAQVEMLTRLGCSTAQGFLFARPVPAAEVHALLARDGSTSREAMSA